MHAVRATARLLVAVLCVAVAGACTDPGPGGPPGTRPTTTAPTPTTRPPATAPLVAYTASGGLCPEGLCGAKVTIYRSGAWHATTGGREIDGQLDPVTTRDLVLRIDRQVGSLATLPRGPELCPSAYDGSDITITFHSGTTPVTVTNCDQQDRRNNREIPGTNALLAYTTQLVSRLLLPQTTPDRLLVEYHESGGHCMETCPEHDATVYVDGRWVATAGVTSTNGELGSAATADLTRRIRSQVATLDRLPGGSCPSFHDGRDIEITFHVDGRTVEVSNCEKDFEGNPLLDHTIELVGAFF